MGSNEITNSKPKQGEEPACPISIAITTLAARRPNAEAEADSASLPQIPRWHDAVENSALRRGNLGVTPWKSWRYPVEILASPRGCRSKIALQTVVVWEFTLCCSMIYRFSQPTLWAAK